MRCIRRIEHVVKVIGSFPHNWRFSWMVSMALLVVAAAGSCGREGEQQDDRRGISPEHYRRSGTTTSVIAEPPGFSQPLCDIYRAERRGNFIQWSRDGAFIVFDGLNGLYQAADGSAVRWIDTEPTPEWHAFDLSPDGRQLVYSSCPVRYDTLRTYNLHRASIDGTRSERLVEGTARVLFASWSPDGTRIAHTAGGLTVMAVDGSTSRPIETGIGTVAGAPQWSPDSQRLAVTGVGPGECPAKAIPIEYREALYTVRADGSDLRRLVRRVASPPTWSPDGQWLAYARVYRNAVILAAIRADGTDERLITTIMEGAQSRGPNALPFWIRTVAWSPDGRHLMHTCGEFLEHLCVVTADGRLVGRTPVALSGASMGAWSPDGTRIAVIGTHPDDRTLLIAVNGMPLDVRQRLWRDVMLYTMEPDGTRLCALVVARYDADARSPIERLWRRIFGLEAEYPLVAVDDCEAAA